MDILFVSTVCSNKFLQYLHRIGRLKPMYSIQKFHKLLLTGFIDNKCHVDTLTSIPCSRSHYNKIFFFVRNEKENGINFHYSPCVNLALIKNICDFINSFIFTFFWCIRHKKGVVIYDVLNITISLGALFASKLLRHSNVGIVTDMPGLMVQADNKYMSVRLLASRINKCYISRFDSYVFLTEQMNDIINIFHCPYIVMEGLVDSKMCIDQKLSTQGKRNLIYAGALYERYGVKMLLDAFQLIKKDFPDVCLNFYGYGPMAEDLQKISYCDSQIVFHGVVPNEQVVAAEIRATLLINPRPTHEEFTKYSFPSKNMEYMVSGTPVLTTKLPGMPQEYYPFVYLLEEETVLGLKDRLNEILSLSDDDLYEKGKSAQQFVLEQKNNIIQAKRILELIR